jgi:toxin-antitoxin system PIN domain toxin
MSREVYLLDANVLIALATPDHSAHERALDWFRQGLHFATCPITQGALIRFYLRWATNPSMAEAKALLRRISEMPAHDFWPDDVSYVDLPERGVVGHRQVTDAYLVSLVSAKGGFLATMDKALATFHPSHVKLI